LNSVHPEIKKTADTEWPPKLIWEAVVQATDSIGTDEAKQIRVLLYLSLVSREGSSFWDRIKCRVNFVRRLGSLKEKALPPAPKGLPLFAFLYDTPANSNNLLPVFQAARRRGWHPTILTGERVNFQKMWSEKSPYLTSLAELVSVTTIKERLRAFATAREQFAAVLYEFERKSIHLASKLRDGQAGIISELTVAITAVRGLRELYAVWEPSCVVSTSNMWPFDCAIFDEADRSHIPSFVIQHGVTNHYWWPFVADKMLLWGKSFEKELLDLGAPADQLSVCGMPAADHLFSRYQGKAVGDHNKKASSVVVLSHTHARGANPALYKQFHTFLKAIITAEPSIQWLVKLHPNEDESFYRSMLECGLPNFKLLPKTLPLEEAVTRADLACTLFSTSGLEAMIMRRPLVVFDIAPAIRDYAWWPKFGGGLYVHTCEAMRDFLSESNSDASFLRKQVIRQDRFLLENFANHGTAAEAILDRIENELRDVNPGSALLKCHS
jgi:hypothetical protein